MLEMALIAGNSNPALAEKIALHLKKGLVSCEVGRFSDGEISVSINESLRGKHVFVLQSICNSLSKQGEKLSVNDSLMELLVLCDAARRGNAEKITAVVPYLGYARQDRKAKPREPITAKLVTDLIVRTGVHDLIAVDLHSDQIEGFVDCYFGNVTVSQLVPETIKKIGFDKKDTVVVSPDSGGAKKAKRLADLLTGEMAIVHKHRPRANASFVTHVVGDVKGKNALLFDDIIDTGGSIVNAAQACLDNGANKVAAFITHPVLSGEAFEKIEASPLEKLFVTDTIPLKRESKKIEVVSIAPTLARVINSVYTGESVSALFK
ncbi:MAG TPA: ribose-phosphate pyrophosphokinase [Candidatus Norongarragalinales archaeon]|nr:ribose-phosphate pyrophosphokinase [Candidatus Norongarragalinales archaeon]